MKKFLPTGIDDKIWGDFLHHNSVLVLKFCTHKFRVANFHSIDTLLCRYGVELIIKSRFECTKYQPHLRIVVLQQGLFGSLNLFQPRLIDESGTALDFIELEQTNIYLMWSASINHLPFKSKHDVIYASLSHPSDVNDSNMRSLCTDSRNII